MGWADTYKEPVSLLFYTIGSQDCKEPLCVVSSALSSSPPSALRERLCVAQNTLVVSDKDEKQQDGERLSFIRLPASPSPHNHVNANSTVQRLIPVFDANPQICNMINRGAI